MATKKVTAYKTCAFRIHNPSKRLQKMLDAALRQNHLAYTKALKAVLQDVEEYAALGKRERQRRLPKDVAAIIQPIRSLSIGAKAGIINDVHGQVESYLELREKQEKADRPTARMLDASPEAWEAVLDDFTNSMTVEEFEANQARLMTAHKAGLPRPLLFLKNQKEDGFLVLYAPDNGSYRIWLNLHRMKSPQGNYAREVSVAGLIDCRTGKPIAFKSRTGVLVPVAFGRDYQLEGFINRARSQSAKLCKIVGDDGSAHFEVHVTYLFEAEPVEARTILAVDRGIYNLASIAVLDESGRVVHRENIDGMTLRHVQREHERRQRRAQKNARHYTSNPRKAMADEAVHYAANRIVALAAKHGSQVVLEDLSNMTSRAKPRAPSNFNRILGRSQYAKLESFLEYKLKIEGLPKVRKVNAAGTSQTCFRCGCWSPKNREKRPRMNGDGFDLGRFSCVECGYTDDADLNAAAVIGQKKRWRDQLPKHLQKVLTKDIPEKYSFGQFLKNSCHSA